MGAATVVPRWGTVVLAAGLLGGCVGQPPQPPAADEVDGRGDQNVDEHDTDHDGDSGESTGEGLDDGSEGGSGRDVASDQAPTLTCADAAASQSGLGCEFWAVDLPNVPAGPGTAPDDLPFVVAIANPRSGHYAKVRVAVGAIDTPIEVLELGPGEAQTLALPSMSIPQHSTGIGELAYRVTSDSPVAVIQFNPLAGETSSSDASTLLPTHRLRTEYTAVTGNGLWFASSFSFAGAFVSVVATEDDTIIDVFPSWHNLAPGDLAAVHLDRGEVFTTLSQSNIPLPQLPYEQAELTGSRVVASRPVAVFSGNVSTQEPIGTCCADHLEEQLAPTGEWGTAYLAVPPPGADAEQGGGDPAVYRVVATTDGTPLSYWPEAPEGAPATIDADQTVRFETEGALWVTSDDPSKPISMTQFLLSNHAMGGGSRPGDPAMLALPDRARFARSHVVFSPEAFADNFVTIVRVAGSDVTLDDDLLEHGDWRGAPPYAGVAYEYASLPVDAGVHEIRCDAACSVIAVGYGDDVSYGYVAAADAPPAIEG